MSFLKSAYDCGAQGLVNRSITDKVQQIGLLFISCDDPTMRRVASWLLTNYEDRIEELVKRLWKDWQRGCETVVLLLQIPKGMLVKMLNTINKGLPLDLILEMAEEIKRSGREVPGLNFYHHSTKIRFRCKMQC